MTVDILGTTYTIEFVGYFDDKNFEKYGFSGYCSNNTKKIVICDLNTHPNWKDDPEEAKLVYTNTVLRHEIVHAFLFESGLAEASNRYGGAWAQNEEMVDWFALQGCKICKAWEESKCIL